MSVRQLLLEIVALANIAYVVISAQVVATGGLDFFKYSLLGPPRR